MTASIQVYDLLMEKFNPWSSNVSIDVTTLKNIKTIFDRAHEKAFPALFDVIERIKKEHQYTQLIYTFNDQDYPTKIVLVKPYMGNYCDLID